MSDLLLNDKEPVLSARISAPRTGAWSADVVLATEAELTPGDTARISSPQDQVVVWAGKVVRSAITAGRTHVRLAGGTGLGKQVTAKHYKDSPLPVRLPLRDLLSECGETLSADTLEAILSEDLRVWTRPAQSGASALQALCDHLGCFWRILPSGTVFLGRSESWTEVQLEGEVVEENPERGMVVLACETPEFSIVPGKEVSYGLEGKSGKVSLIEHSLEGEKYRLRLLFEQGSSRSDRLTSAITALVSRAAPLDYLALYPALVITQDADNSLQVRPDDERLPSLRGVPLRLPVPGATVRVVDGARVLVGFEHGSPAKPVALLWENGSAKSVVITTASGATISLGESGDVRINTSGGVNVAAANDSTNGHLHSVTGTAGPYPISGGIAITTTDTIAPQPARKVFV